MSRPAIPRVVFLAAIEWGLEALAAGEGFRRLSLEAKLREHARTAKVSSTSFTSLHAPCPLSAVGYAEGPPGFQWAIFTRAFDRYIRDVLPPSWREVEFYITETR
jgi:hypothetical protein